MQVAQFTTHITVVMLNRLHSPLTFTLANSTFIAYAVIALHKMASSGNQQVHSWRNMLELDVALVNVVANKMQPEVNVLSSWCVILIRRNTSRRLAVHVECNRCLARDKSLSANNGSL